MTRLLALALALTGCLLAVHVLDWWGRELNSHECVEVTR